MVEAFYAWSEANLGQWHYILGYSITLVSHNWPIMFALALAIILSVALYRRPSRARACWLFTALIFGLAYEYEKHVAGELHSAIDFLISPEQGEWNRWLHLFVGPTANTALLIGSLALLAQSIRLSLLARREASAQITPRAAGPNTFNRDDTSAPGA